MICYLAAKIQNFFKKSIIPYLKINANFATIKDLGKKFQLL